MSALTNSGETVIQSNQIIPNHQNSSQFVIKSPFHYFQLQKLATWLRERHFRNVTIQVPDEFVTYSTEILAALERDVNEMKLDTRHVDQHVTPAVSSQITDIEEFSRDESHAQQTPPARANTNSNTTHFTIMADTSYGSCCVDEITASKVNADCIIHLGSRACLQYISSKQVGLVNVPGVNELFDAQACFEQLRKFLNEHNEDTKVVVLYELQFWKGAMEGLMPLIEENNLQDRILVATVNTHRLIQNDPLASDPNATPLEFTKQHHFHDHLLQQAQNQDSTSSDTSTFFEINGQIFPYFAVDEYEEAEKYKMFYIGQESDHLAQIMLEFNACEFARYDGVKNTMDDASSPQSRITRMVRRRYFLTEKAKDVNTFGILIATVTVRHYLHIVKHIQKLLKDNGKQYYMFYVGKVNVPKLANFSEIEMFVLVSCGQNSLLDSKDYLAPMITPYELEVALGERQAWDGHIVTEFDKLLVADKAQHDGEKKSSSTDEEPRFSLITGSYVGSNVEEPTKTIVNADGATTLVPTQSAYELVKDSSAISFFHEKRTFKGLEQKLGETPFAEVEQGLSGIPKNYESETAQ